jgi:hypothetical protein
VQYSYYQYYYYRTTTTVLPVLLLPYYYYYRTTTTTVLLLLLPYYYYWNRETAVGVNRIHVFHHPTTLIERIIGTGSFLEVHSTGTHSILHRAEIRGPKDGRTGIPHLTSVRDAFILSNNVIVIILERKHTTLPIGATDRGYQVSATVSATGITIHHPPDTP